jgi:hypothetical protein
LQDWVAKGQCDCIYYHNTYGHDFPIVGALIAPRPLMILSAKKDSIFPPSGYHEVYERTKSIYDLYGAEGDHEQRLREVEDDVEHTDSPLFLQQARWWMQRWLQGDPSEFPDEKFQPALEAPADLACLSSVPNDAANFRIHSQFTVTATLHVPKSIDDWTTRRGELIEDLRSKTFRWFPAEAVPFNSQALGESSNFYDYADVQEFSFQTEHQVRIKARLYRPKSQPNAPLLLYVKRASDAGGRWFMDEFLSLLPHMSILVVNPRLTEQSMSPAEFADIQRSSVFVGRTIASMHVWDILRTIEWAVKEQQLRATDVTLYGQGEMGIVCLYAGLFDDRIRQVILHDAPGSHWQGPALLNVLRITDIPEVAAAFAPRRLVSLTRWPEEFKYTSDVYRLHGASDRVVSAGSLPDALQSQVNSSNSQ